MKEAEMDSEHPIDPGGVAPEMEGPLVSRADRKSSEPGRGRIPDPESLYFREISRYPLLNREEERRLAESLRKGRRRLASALLGPPMRGGNLFRRLIRLSDSPAGVSPVDPSPRDLERMADFFLKRVYPNRFRLPDSLRSILSETEWAGVHEKIGAAMGLIHRSREALILANMRLVVSIALKYAGFRMALPDLVQEGNIGLMKAVERYDPRLGNRFSSYAVWWIRQTISRAIDDQSRTIRIPSHMLTRVRRIRRAAEAISSRFGREPDPVEIGLKAGVAPERLEDMLLLAAEPLSLENPPETVFQRPEDFLADPRAASVQEGIEYREVVRALAVSMNRLNPIERKVVEMHYGLTNDRETSLTEIGRRLSLTKERIRQIRNRALQRLKKPFR